jgi:hypothetical protein
MFSPRGLAPDEPIPWDDESIRMKFKEPQMFSPEYKTIQEKFHIDRPDYGTSGKVYSEQVFNVARSLQTRDILDYGCGKCTLAKSLPFAIQNYDPFIPEYAAAPNPADLVVCTDVMEHVEDGYVNSVLADIKQLAKKAAFFQIATRSAGKTLPDGRNAHLIVAPSQWWIEKLNRFFEPVSFQAIPGGFFYLGYPLQVEE